MVTKQQNQASFVEQDELFEQELIEIAEQTEKDEKLSQPNLDLPKIDTINMKRKPEKQLTLENFLFKKQETPENENTQTPERTGKTTPKIQKPTPKTPRQEKRPKLSTSMKPDSEKKKKESYKKRKKHEQEQEKKSIQQLRSFWNNFAERHSSTRNSISTSNEGFDTSSIHQNSQASRPGAGRESKSRIGQTSNQNSSANILSNNQVIADLHLKSESPVKTRSNPRD